MILKVLWATIKAFADYLIGLAMIFFVLVGPLYLAVELAEPLWMLLYALVALFIYLTLYVQRRAS